MNKKGVSEIVTVILIILLSITAVIIIWQVISPLIQRTETGTLSADCFTLSMDITSAQNNGVDANITVKRGVGEGRLYKIVVIKSSGGSDSIVNNGTVSDDLDIFETKTIVLSGVQLAAGEFVKIAPIIKDPDGTDVFQCDIMDSYEVP
ncbi:MAG: hypothetical protein ABIH72_01645 [archaeon]